MPTLSPIEEKELLSRVAAGDEAAFRQLFDTYRTKLYAYIYKMTEYRESAEDTVHDVFLKIWESRANLDHVENLNAYLHRMAHNYAYTGFRRLAKETLILKEIRRDLASADGPRHSAVTATAATTPDSRIESAEVRTMIRDLVDRLTPQQKQVFLMSREEGLRQDAIAANLNISVNTVKNHLAAALKFLRDEITRHYGPQAVAIFVIYNLHLP